MRWLELREGNGYDLEEFIKVDMDYRKINNELNLISVITIEDNSVVLMNENITTDNNDINNCSKLFAMDGTIMKNILNSTFIDEEESEKGSWECPSYHARPPKGDSLLEMITFLPPDDEDCKYNLVIFYN